MEVHSKGKCEAEDATLPNATAFNAVSHVVVTPNYKIIFL